MESEAPKLRDMTTGSLTHPLARNSVDLEDASLHILRCQSGNHAREADLDFTPTTQRQTVKDFTSGLVVDNHRTASTGPVTLAHVGGCCGSTHSRASDVIRQRGNDARIVGALIAERIDALHYLLGVSQ